jgi:hypothetical protein
MVQSLHRIVRESTYRHDSAEVFLREMIPSERLRRRVHGPDRIFGMKQNPAGRRETTYRVVKIISSPRGWAPAEETRDQLKTPRHDSRRIFQVHPVAFEALEKPSLVAVNLLRYTKSRTLLLYR